MEWQIYPFIFEGMIGKWVILFFGGDTSIAVVTMCLMSMAFPDVAVVTRMSSVDGISCSV